MMPFIAYVLPEVMELDVDVLGPRPHLLQSSQFKCTAGVVLEHLGVNELCLYEAKRRACVGALHASSSAMSGMASQNMDVFRLSK